MFRYVLLFILSIGVAHSATLKGRIDDPMTGISWWIFDYSGQLLTCSPAYKDMGTPVICYDQNRTQWLCSKADQTDGYITDCRPEDWANIEELKDGI